MGWLEHSTWARGIYRITLLIVVFGFSLVLFGCSLFPAVSIEANGNPGLGPELFTNPDFEEVEDLPDPLPKDWSADASQVAGWSIWVRDGTDGKVLVTNEDAYSDEYSIKVIDSESTVFQQVLRPEKGATYRFSAYLKSNMTGNVGIGVDIRTVSGDPAYFKRPSIQLSEEAKDGQDWHLLVLEFTMPDDDNASTNVQFKLSVGEQNEGEFAYFDRASLRRVESP